MPDPTPPIRRKKIDFLPAAATFQLKEPLGVGTVGAVFRAESPDIDQPIAIKLLHPSIAHDPKIVDRFQREITIMERLDHPHIVRNYGGGIMDGQYFYAMQLLDHGTLKQRLKQQGPLPWQQVAALSSQIASALQHAHNHSIIHRDLKPSNLFFDAQGNVVLGDFGIARDTQDSDISAEGITVGTYAYMSPEQICADRNISGKADLYSLGCVMFEMLTGKPPFTGMNFAQIWDQHLHQQPKSIRDLQIDCPEWLERVVFQLLEKDPENRPFSARAVQGMLKDHLEIEFDPDLKKITENQPSLKGMLPSDGSNKSRILIATLVAAAIFGAVWMWAR